MEDGIRSEVKSYSFLGACDLYQAAVLAMSHGTHPNDMSNRYLHGASPRKLLKLAIDMNMKRGGNQEDAAAHLQGLAEGYAKYGMFGRSMKVLEEAESLVAGHERALLFRRVCLNGAKVRILKLKHTASGSANDLDDLELAIKNEALARREIELTSK